MQRAIVASCIRIPGTLPNLAPARELYAMTIIPLDDGAVRQP
jgi:hypothetical protein